MTENQSQFFKAFGGATLGKLLPHIGRFVDIILECNGYGMSEEEVGHLVRVFMKRVDTPVVDVALQKRDPAILRALFSFIETVALECVVRARSKEKEAVDDEDVKGALLAISCPISGCTL